MRLWLQGCFFFACAACHGSEVEHVLQIERLADMPLAITNNAVAARGDGHLFELYSFLGLESGKAWQNTSRAVLRFSSHADVTQGSWERLASVPGSEGRLAASAVTVDEAVYLFGGYTVAPDGAERSTSEVYQLAPGGTLELFTTMPVPVDDAVLGVFEDRWVYVISGWHDVGNVNLVQVLDTREKIWTQATPFPGAPVFGHAGGLLNNAIVVCDGVRIAYQAAPGPRAFVPSNECWKGTIDPQEFRRIDWKQLQPHPGSPRYRSAAGNDGQTRIFFVGGSANPYNYDGMGYDGRPSEPLSTVLSYDIEADRWEDHGSMPVATMDHRGLPYHDGWFYVAGGMRENQVVSEGFFRFKP